MASWSCGFSSQSCHWYLAEECRALEQPETSHTILPYILVLCSSNQYYFILIWNEVWCMSKGIAEKVASLSWWNLHPNNKKSWFIFTVLLFVIVFYYFKESDLVFSPVKTQGIWMEWILKRVFQWDCEMLWMQLPQKWGMSSGFLPKISWDTPVMTRWWLLLNNTTQCTKVFFNPKTILLHLQSVARIKALDNKR